ncbi:MAG: methionyl-tRNA formyltransferase [Gammaproteobacteria bacterium]|nr:methionyl-tRNA formyltransferase [Gammaproteobacteria bacterium]
MNFRIVFAGTPHFASVCLEALLHAKHTIVGVYTQADKPSGRGRAIQYSPVKTLGLAHEIPVYQPTRLKDPIEQDQLRSLKPDLMVVAAYGLLLPKTVLDIPTHGCMNVHASLLPRFRGASPIQAALLAGDTETGISMMRMDEGLDSGDVILRETCTIDPRDTTASLQDRLAQLGAKALLKSLAQIKHKTALYTPQDLSKVCFAPKLCKTDAAIDWTESAAVLDRKIRAFNPWPIATMHKDELCIRIWDAMPITMSSTARPGTVVAHNKDSIDIKTGDGVLRLLELQLPNAKRLKVSEILKSKAALFSIGTQWF